MSINAFSSLLAHGAVKDEHYEKLRTHPNKAEISDEVISKHLGEKLPEKFAHVVLNDDSLKPLHHEVLSSRGLSGDIAMKYLHDNAHVDEPDGPNAYDHVIALASAANNPNLDVEKVRSHLARIPNKVHADKVIPMFKGSTSEDLNDVNLDNRNLSSLSSHNNADDALYSKIHSSEHLPRQVRETALGRMVDNRKNKLTHVSLDHAYGLDKGYHTRSAVVSHQGASDETIHKIISSGEEIGHRALGSMMENPNVSHKTKLLAKDTYNL